MSPSTSYLCFSYLFLTLFLFIENAASLREGQCEGKLFLFSLINFLIYKRLISLLVCVGVINKLINKLDSSEKNDVNKIEKRFKEMCLESKKAENRFVSRFASFLENSRQSLNIQTCSA